MSIIKLYSKKNSNPSDAQVNTGTSLGEDGNNSVKIAQDTRIADDVIALEYRKDRSNTTRTIEGWAVPGSLQTDPVWRIRATDVVGTLTHQFFTDDNDEFDNKWSTRVADLPAIPFLNSFSIQFSGDTNAFGIVPHSGDIDFASTEAWSVSFWIKTTFTSSRTIYQKSNGTGGNNGLTISLDGSSRVEVEWRGIGIGDRARVRTDSLGSIVINDGSWHLIIVTHGASAAASALKVYVDNIDQTLNILNDTLLIGPTTNLNDLYFGSNVGGGARVRGNFDELAIWDAELSSSEASEIWNSNSGVIDLQTASGQISSNLVSWWRFGDGSFSALPTIPDEEGTNDMTMQSAITTGDLETEVPP